MVRFRVKELARERGLTSEELAYKSGVKLSTVRNLWQNRVQDPAYSTLAAIARALEVRIEDLVVAGGESSSPSDRELKTTAPIPAAA